MKFIHISDLHLGKRLNEFSLIEDQEYILSKILDIVDSEAPDGILIAGDIYDKSIPSAEAVRLFDDFLVGLCQRKLQVFIISGNHDSAERLSFGSRLMENSGIHIAPVYDGHITPIKMMDSFGPLEVYLLPFIKPVHVRSYFQDEQIYTYTDAVRTALSTITPNEGVRRILVTHQFVTGASRSESEDISVGGTDNVDLSVFDGFDYVALGHIHSPQSCGEERVRYCGTPLKYSFSEAKDIKSVTVVELAEKDSLTIRTHPLIPLRDMHELKGSYQSLTEKSFYDNTGYQKDYIHITLTDEDDIPYAMDKLRTVYPYLMKLDYDNKRTQNAAHIIGTVDMEKKSPLQLFADFYELQNNQPMTDTQEAFIQQLIEKTWEGEN